MDNRKIVTESEEMYLITIARLEEQGQPGPVPLSQLAELLSIQTASANQMVRQLEKAGWVRYAPYLGVALTEAGRSHSQRVLRNHRLWEVFFVEQLGLLPETADALACRMEHLIPEEPMERLARFLGQPSLCPDGKPIPPAGTTHEADGSLALNDLQVQQAGTISKIQADGAIRAFLKSEGLIPGTAITVLAIGDQGSRLVGLPGGPVVHLSPSIGQSLRVQPHSQNP